MPSQNETSLYSNAYLWGYRVGEGSMGVGIKCQSGIHPSLISESPWIVFRLRIRNVLGEMTSTLPYPPGAFSA
jgi:hypothetical protein